MVDEIGKEALEWRGNAPVAPRFGDVYYSAENGLEETGFVFLQGTGAPAVWQDRDHYVIAETGFGTGLNFLATWKAWKESGTPGRLTFISVEGYPLSREALKAAHESFPDIAAYARKLYDAWPPPAPGFHPRTFEDGKITLILLFGDAEHAFKRLSATVDAWYLDGFAPAKNPDMWSDAVLDEIARLSRPGTRFATFTAAGFVRRGLQARGFRVEKVPGYGRKRERLVGEMETPPAYTAPRPYPDWATPPSTAADGPIAVVGAGIAGLSIADALRRRGRDVTVISGSLPSASRVPAAILSPRFSLDDQPQAQFFSSAFAYSGCFAPFRDAWAQERGIEVRAKPGADTDWATRIAAHLKWGQDWLQPLEGGFMLPMGGSLDTEKALAALGHGLPHMEADITALERDGDGWRLLGPDGDTVLNAASVVIATGMTSADLSGAGDRIELRPNGGQIERLPTSAAPELAPHSFAFGGYVTAAVGGERTLGSTFDRLTTGTAYPPSEDARARILAALEASTGVTIDPASLTGSWTGIRATTADHLPFVGQMPDWDAAAEQYAPLAKDARTRNLGAPSYRGGLYILTGLGSKGFQYGPLAAEYLAAQMTGEPLPLPTDLAPTISPLKGFIRGLIRGTVQP
ncbi:tRNA (5-methylaminomethyl-2-thiouridine)(34)-methyltransferase MnmD [Kordiimonas marina]|uniref:tRNA (5-methylaminomethyl-2-thiouridine)(34)-methyltransferase MnmD n=1 Tax=Kordiimonas marina TaxID=2872312 RepID=UPI001FF0FE88|nr:tRNA (5-methylaminomethyl-2-thiouridine)(34)-methyltransferase MnmD [Kordiimonas marina]MCJ9429122.1 tRNA (5-methylaminomethyl-2-thiouridine)(34)-methyltransferase MnmD [Kordiimonas marina]